MQLEKKRLSEIEKSSIIELLNHPLVKKHMPLSAPNVGDKEYEDFINAKEAIWSTHDFGPWAYVINGQFIGWGGIQPDEDEFEIALVLHPDYWGYGKQIYNEIIHFAFHELKLPSVVVYFPPSRTRIKALIKAGFKKVGETEFSGCTFIRYRLQNKML